MFQHVFISVDEQEKINDKFIYPEKNITYLDQRNYKNKGASYKRIKIIQEVIHIHESLSGVHLRRGPSPPLEELLPSLGSKFHYIFTILL